MGRDVRRNDYLDVETSPVCGFHPLPPQAGIALDKMACIMEG